GDSLKWFGYDPDHTFAWLQVFQETQTTCTNPLLDPDSGYTCETTEPLDHTDYYTRDDAGNLLNGVTQMDPGNRVRAANGVSYNYDADGNLSSSSQSGVSRTFAWDALGQLTSVTTNGNTVTFGYDAFGRRVRKTVSGTSTFSVYEGDNLFLSLNASGSVVAEYASWPGLDNPHSVQVGGQTYYFSPEPV